MNRIKAVWRYMLIVHLLALLFLTIIRLVLLLSNKHYLNEANVTLSYLSSAFVRGIWFDNVIACYINIVPIVILSVLALCNRMGKAIIRIFNIYYIVLFGLVFAISIADIPYFNYFFKHLNASVFNWKEEGGNAMQMILQESSYYIYFLLFFIIFAIFIVLVLKTGKKTIKDGKGALARKQYYIYIPITAVLIGLTILGIRGKFGRNPIKTSQAYFCNNSFLNQLGLNPTFYLLRSIIENSKKHKGIDQLLNENEALKYAQQELGIPIGQKNPTALFRHVEGKTSIENVNIVFILMESMSANYLDLKNGSLTPYLNELKKDSYYFSNFYSTGNHTNQGVTATIFGLPSLFDKNMMKNVDIPQCYGVSSILEKKGYNTAFFVTHESQYDNMNAVFLENGIHRVYAQEDYPSNKVVNGFGVQDDYLFDYALNTLNGYAKSKKPFFATILTISNHPPYIIPERYKHRSDKPEEQGVAFADDAIKVFMTEAKKQDWYKNTIFVLLGDHGKLVGKPTYDMPLSYNHIPLIIHSPLLKDTPKTFDNLGGQMDVFPTVLGLLGYSYTNNTLGVDILAQKRPYVYFTSDSQMGCVDNKYFYIYDPVSKTEELYNYRDENPHNQKNEFRSLADSMKTYSASMLISTEYLLKNKLARVKNL